MRVLMTADTVGGVWTYSMQLIRALMPHGVHFALATMGDRPSADQRRQVSQLPVQLYESSYTLEWMEEPWEDVESAGQWLLEIEREFQPDLIHLNGYSHGQVAFGCPVLIVAHSCVFSWWEAVKGETAPAQWDRYRQEVGGGVRCADRVVAPSRAMLREIEKHYGPTAQTQVIYNAADPSRFQPRPSKENFVCCAGRTWDEGKNIAALQRIAPRLSWPICIAGAESSSTQPAENCVFLGRLNEEMMSEWLGRAMIYAHPARYEPFGLSILEAALSGCALVLGDIDSLREIWDDAAVYVPPGEDEALFEAIEGLIRFESERNEMALRARARAAQYSPHRMAQSYLAAYRTLLNQSHRRQRAPAECGEGLA